MKIICVLILLIVIISSCSISKKTNTQNSNLLSYEKIYSFDNKIDTIIKNYESYKMLANQGLLIPSKQSLSHDTFVTEYGSTYTSYLRFHKDNSGEILDYNKRISSDTVAKYMNFTRSHKSELINKDKFKFEIYNTDSLRFKINLSSDVTWFFRGKIYADSIVFFVLPKSSLYDNDIFRQSIYPNRTYTILR